MQNFYDYKKFAILYVDDEEKSLKYFTLAFGEQFRIFTATNAQDGYRLLEEHPDDIGLLMTDQRMPVETGVQLLEKARQLRPRIIRILATAYSDVESAIAAVNTGAIYKYITKPWEVPMLEITLKRGLEFFMVQRERDQLLHEKMSVLHKMVITDRVLSLGVMAAGMGHHVRNALVAVRTFLDLAPEMLLRENLDLEELRHPNFWNEFYEKVQGKVKLIVGMMDDLGEAAEKPIFRFSTPVHLDEMLNQILQRMKGQFANHKISITNEISADLPVLLVNYPKFYRLFELLFQDELINLPEGSQVVVRAQLNPASLPGQPEVEVLIHDNGPGLPRDALRSIFDPFFVRSGKPQEFGLKLMACYFLVYHHGGRVEVRSTEGNGVTFVITLPTNPKLQTTGHTESDFMSKVMMNERLWEKLLTSS